VKNTNTVSSGTANYKNLWNCGDWRIIIRNRL